MGRGENPHANAGIDGTALVLFRHVGSFKPRLFPRHYTLILTPNLAKSNIVRTMDYGLRTTDVVHSVLSYC